MNEPSVIFVSITRLRIRYWLYLPAFFVAAGRSASQAKAAPGCIGVCLLRDADNAFWTRTLWESEADMRGYMLSGSHGRVMPRLAGWCDEAAVVHWTQESAAPPDWDEAYRRLVQDGRKSLIRHPSKNHDAFAIPAPRVGLGREVHFK
jgi:hypothetical protein